MEIINLTHVTIPALIDFAKRNESDLAFFHPHPFDYDVIKNKITWITNDQYKIIIHEGEVIGYGLLRGWDEGYEIPSLGIMIDSKYRGTGLSKMFMRFLETEAKIRGAQKMRLVVYKNNIKAVNTYKSLGYDLQEHDETQLIGFKNL